MKNGPGIPLIIALFLTASLFPLQGAEEKPEHGAAFREDFIGNFKRIGMNTTHEDALFLRILIQSRRAKAGIEVGAANGFGAINMGLGFERTGGKLITIDIDPGMVAQCRSNVTATLR